jgi:hypothetical protein
MEFLLAVIDKTAFTASVVGAIADHLLTRNLKNKRT